MRRLIGFLVPAVLACLCLAPVAGAARWHRFASGGMNVSDQVGIARTGTGALHVLWRQVGAAGQGIDHTPISALGKVGAPDPVVTGWASLGSPAATYDGLGNLSTFFPGTRTLVTGDPTIGIDLAASSNRGATWSVSPTAIATGDFAFARTPAAAVTFDGRYIQAWYGGEQSVVHGGLNPLVRASQGYGAGIDQALATYRDGHTMLAWCASLGTPEGVFTAEVNPDTGARSGPVVHLPGTGRCPADTRVALSTFGIRTQYVQIAASSADGRRVRVFQLKGPTITGVTTIAGGSSFKQQITLSNSTQLRTYWAAWRTAIPATSSCGASGSAARGARRSACHCPRVSRSRSSTSPRRAAAPT